MSFLYFKISNCEKWFSVLFVAALCTAPFHLISVDNKNNGEIKANYPKGIGQYGRSQTTTNRDYWREVAKSEKKDMTYIITTLSQSSLLSIANERSSLKKAGQRIEHVHPLRFLCTIFSDEELKIGIKGIRERSSWIWDEFFSNFKDNLEKEDQKNNILSSHVKDLAKKIKIDSALIIPIINRKDWGQLILTLIEIVPRHTDPDRYKMSLK